MSVVDRIGPKGGEARMNMQVLISVALRIRCCFLFHPPPIEDPRPAAS